MSNRKISQLPPTSLPTTLEDTDRLPLARAGTTYYILGSDIKAPILSQASLAANSALLTKVNSLSARDTSTIDLDFNTIRYTLSANVIDNSITANKLSISTSDIQIGSLGVGIAATGTLGEIRATNDITAYATSDASLKENIKPIENALEKVNAITGVEYDWKDSYIENKGGEDGTFVKKHDVGVIAQEIEKVLPEVVCKRQDNTLAVRYEKIIPLLIEAIKEISKQVEELKKEK